MDTPGIGNSQEHTEMLMSYIPNAVAFVFVVNVANAGGFQRGRVILISNNSDTIANHFPIVSVNLTVDVK